MAAITHDFRVEAGAGFTVTFARTDSAGTALPFATGTTAEFQARVTARATGSPLLTTTPTIDHTAGTITLTLTDVQTRALDLPTIDSVVYAIELHKAGTPDARFAEGRITCSPEVVRP